MFNIVFFSALVALATCNVIPSYIFKPCHKSEGDVSKCFKDQIIKARPYFEEGIPEVNVPKLNPLELKEVLLDHKASEMVWVKGKVENIFMTGFKEMIIEEFHFDPDTLTADMKMKFPVTMIKMDVDVIGQVLIIPVITNGHFEGNFTDSEFYAKAYFKMFKKNDVEYFRVHKLQFSTSTGGGSIKLVPKNPALQFGADLISNYFNNSPKQVLDAINPIYVRIAASFIKDTANQILGSIPAEEIVTE